MNNWIDIVSPSSPNKVVQQSVGEYTFSAYSAEFVKYSPFPKYPSSVVAKAANPVSQIFLATALDVACQRNNSRVFWL